MRALAALPRAAGLAVAVTLGLWTGQVQAHAGLSASSPTADERLAAAPSEIRLTFSERPEPALTRVWLTDASGREVASGPLAVAADDPSTLVLGLGALPPGEYTVGWNVVSIDTHSTQGSFTFVVQP